MSQQITIIDQVKDIETRSGVQFELDITQVVNLAERGRAITSVNDPDFLAVKKEMQQTRKYVTEYFKDARDEFNKISKGIIQIEKTVLAKFTPEEDRLIELDRAEKARLIRESRLEGLPAKKEKLNALAVNFDDFVYPTDDEILEQDDGTFLLWFNEQQGLKNEQIAKKLAEEQAVLDAKKAEAERIEKAREDERKLAEGRAAAAKLEAEAEIARLKTEAAEKEAARLRAIEDERIAKEKVEAEARAEEIRLSKLKALNDYRATIDFDLERRDGENMLVFYKKVGEFKIE